MTHLLHQVYSGKVTNLQTKVNDIGGQNMDATMVAGCIKIATIDQVRANPPSGVI